MNTFFQLENRENLMSHLGSHRHLGNKRNFTPVFQDGNKPTGPNGQNEWPLPKSRHSQPDEIGGGLPKPHKRFRPDEVDEPWRFSPSEAEQQDRYQARISSPSKKDDDGGFDYNDDAGGADDYRDDDSPPPAPTSFPSLPLPFSLPKPVPIVLPKPVPILSRNLDLPQPVAVPISR